MSVLTREQINEMVRESIREAYEATLEDDQIDESFVIMLQSGKANFFHGIGNFFSSKGFDNNQVVMIVAAVLAASGIWSSILNILKDLRKRNEIFRKDPAGAEVERILSQIQSRFRRVKSVNELKKEISEIDRATDLLVNFYQRAERSELLDADDLNSFEAATKGYARKISKLRDRLVRDLKRSLANEGT